MFLNKINGPDFVHTNEAHFKKRSRELHFIEYISNTLTLLTRLGTLHKWVTNALLGSYYIPKWDIKLQYKKWKNLFGKLL